MQHKRKDLRELYGPDKITGEANPEKLEELSALRRRHQAKDRVMKRFAAVFILVLLAALIVLFTWIL